jgi:hypothetical protein
MIHVKEYWYSVADLAIKQGILSKEVAYASAEKQIRETYNRLIKLTEQHKDATRFWNFKRCDRS